jgi:heme a synthase
MAPAASLMSDTERDGGDGRAAAQKSPRPHGGPPGAATGRSEWVVGLSCVTLLLTYGLVVLGSTVRVTESGMGCASWPLCNGHIGFTGGYHALLEQSHRYLAATVTVSVCATAWAAWRSTGHRAALAPGLVAAGCVLFQAGFGAVTVFVHNAPWTVAVHLVTGLVFLAVVTVTAVTALHGGNHFHLDPRAAGRWASAAVAATLLLLISGTVVVDGGAARSCPSWPICTHPGPLHLIALQLLHRSVVAIASIAMVGFVVTSWSRMAGRQLWRAGAVGLLTLLCVVATMGAVSALSRARPLWQDLHLACASALWTLLVALFVRAANPDPAVATGPAEQ